VALLAAEDVVVLEVDVVNPEALLDVAVVLEEGGIVELELELLAAVVEAGVVLELLLEERGVVELELLAVEEDTILEVESVDVDEVSGTEDVLDEAVV
jgi:hypothetical protein